ncbi:DUF998 domain-containing protein [Agrococcus casei]|uniref:ABC transporter, permease protein (Putative) n=1 Tax=Agrococcus casei LMG 22410 TaxID=1255656 RepID=A0A1R4GLZ6_9MICO|nr:DUF998 domain-containing protein [Agrococcus casei]SJM69103.1 ABC transporter, permease protein (putative) [Agrococcus casei LMG 22410]
MSSPTALPTSEVARRFEEQTTLAAWGAAALGLLFGLISFGGEARPIAAHAGELDVTQPAAGTASLITAAAFLLSTLLHRRHETRAMPGWQRAVSHISTAMLTVVFGAVAFMAVLTAGEILALGLQGFVPAPIAAALLTAIASAAGSWLAFQAGIELRTRNLTQLLFGYLTIGTLFAMITAADPLWWQLHFSSLGNAWAFNLTVIVAGLLVAAVGLYIGRDLHRWMGDSRLKAIGIVVVLFTATGAALAGVGVFPVATASVAHNIAAIGTLCLFAAAALAVTIVMPGPTPMMTLTTVGAGIALVTAVLLWRPFGVYNLAGLEVIVVGIIFVWLTTLVRTIGASAPEQTRASARTRLLQATKRTRTQT